MTASTVSRTRTSQSRPRLFVGCQFCMAERVFSKVRPTAVTLSPWASAALAIERPMWPVAPKIWGEVSEVNRYGNHSKDSVDSPPIPVVWGDSVVLVDLWLQGVGAWSFAPLPWAMYGHGLARRHLRPCRGSRPRYIFNLHLKARIGLRGRRDAPPHEAQGSSSAWHLALLYQNSLSSLVLDCSVLSLSLPRTPAFITFEIVVEELK